MIKGKYINAFRLLAIIVLIILLPACQTMDSAFHEPLLSLHSVDFMGISFTDMELLFSIRVENPNSFDIPFPDITWVFFLNENQFISGDFRSNGRIRGRASNIVEIPVNINFVEVFNTFSSLMGATQADYRISLAARIPLPVLRGRVWNFQYEGQIPIPQLPRLTGPSMRIENVDLTGVQILVSVNVENPNIFALPPPVLHIDYLVNNVSFINSAVEAPAPLSSRAITPITFRFSVNFADLFSRFITLLTFREVPVQLNISFDFLTPAFSSNNFNIQIPGILPLR